MHDLGRCGRRLERRGRRAGIGDARRSRGGGEAFKFVQVSNCHAGFAKPANPDTGLPPRRAEGYFPSAA